MYILYCLYILCRLYLINLKKNKTIIKCPVDIIVGA